MSAAKFELVSNEAHQHIKVNSQKYDIPENKVNAALVVASELSVLVHDYPIFITKQPNTENYQLTALLGLHAGENLYLEGEKWKTMYLPLDILRKPFQAYIPDPNDTSKGHIAIDMNSELVGDAKGEALFDEQGEPSKYFQRIQSAFAQIMGGTQFTSDLLKQADEMGLLEQVNLTVDLPDGGKANINGLYTFDKEKITALKGEQLERCHELGILQVCHLVMSSGIHMERLIKWYGEK